MSDWLEEYKKNKIKTGIKLGYFTYENKVYCPCCGKEPSDWWELAPSELETWEIVECDKCGKSFRLKTDIVYSTEVMPEDERC